ncbi:MAG: pyridoxal-phosphate dependent enzyme, partial [Terriglobales bacterium]
HSVSAGLDYAAVGPEHAALRDQGRAEYIHCGDTEALAACRFLAETEGIIPALESAHAVAAARRRAPGHAAGAAIIVNISGRGDKDMEILTRELGLHAAS